jgi:hypothetical protein
MRAVMALLIFALLATEAAAQDSRPLAPVTGTVIIKEKRPRIEVDDPQQIKVVDNAMK